MREKSHEEVRAPRWRLPLILALLVLLIGSIVARQSRAAEKPAAGADGAASTLVAGEPPPPAEEPDTLDVVLPYLTEGGVAMLLGLMLGITTRFFVKSLVLILALIFIGIQFLAYKGWIDAPEWGATVVWIRDFVLHVSEDSSVGGLVQRKLPAAAALFLGYALGLKRG